MLKARFTPQAIDDLEGIKRYISEDLSNPRAAADLIALVFEKNRTLVSKPQIGARLQTGIPLLKTYRLIQCDNYLVFYRVEVKNISVIRILYAKRDYLRLLELDKNEDKDG